MGNSKISKFSFEKTTRKFIIAQLYSRIFNYKQLYSRTILEFSAYPTTCPKINCQVFVHHLIGYLSKDMSRDIFILCNE